jgi:hypothetical protein
MAGKLWAFFAAIAASTVAHASTCTQGVLDGTRVLVDDQPGSDEVYQVAPLADTDLGYGTSLPDVISFEFYQIFHPMTSGTFDLGSADNSNYETCEQCVLVYQDNTGGAPQKIFYQTAGTLVVDALTPPGADPITMSWQNVQLAEVTIDPNTFQSTLVPNGACYNIVADKIFANDFE